MSNTNGVSLGQQAAYATPDIELDSVGLRLGQSGLTKRELLAAMLAQGMAAAESEEDGVWDDDALARRAVARADELLKELAK